VGPALGLAGDFRRLVRGDEEGRREGRGGADMRDRATRERGSARAVDLGQGDYWAAGKRSGPKREEGEKGRPGCRLGWLTSLFLSPFLLFFFKLTQFYLNSNET
jgi:hypothetical protein